MRHNPGKRTPGGRIIGAMTEAGLANLHTRLERDLWDSDIRANELEESGEALAAGRERERGDRLRKELEAVEREIQGRDLDRRLLELGGHPSQDPT